MLQALIERIVFSLGPNDIIQQYKAGKNTNQIFKLNSVFFWYNKVILQLAQMMVSI